MEPGRPGGEELARRTVGTREASASNARLIQVQRWAAGSGFALPIPLDTNGLERALCGVAVGRKNHYGSRSERGTRVAALFYSLIESAKLCGVEPRTYLREATLGAVRNPGTVTVPRDLK